MVIYTLPIFPLVTYTTFPSFLVNVYLICFPHILSSTATINDPRNLHWTSASTKDTMEKKHVTIGPFGGQGGKPWDDGIYTGIRQLIIHSDVVIDSIQIEYDQNGQSKLSEKHGGEGGGGKTVKLDYPSEYLLSIWGYYSSDCALTCVQSLTIESNKRIYGPFGTEKGKYFKFPLTRGKIIGFHGRSSNYLDCFGAYSEPISDPIRSISDGPFGGQGGDQWDDGKYNTVRQFKISHGSVIDSIQFEYDDNGKSKWSVKHGRSDGGNKRTVQLNYPDEYLISISGYLTKDSNKAVIQSLTMQSNKNQYGPYGAEKGKHFSTTQSGNGRIVGFHGRSGLYLDSIGAYFESFPVHVDTHQPMILGPLGGSGGNQWDDGVYNTVRQFIICAGVVVDSIQIEYEKNGQSVWSMKHGESTGGHQHTVKFDSPDEILVSISGYYSLESAFFGLHSLTIHSNKRTYGPFGTEIGNHFTVPATHAVKEIIGLHGRSSSHLDAIGAYFTPKPIFTVEPFGSQSGDAWDDGKYSGVKQLVICSGIVIDSIQIEYDQNRQSKWSQKHGGGGGDKNTVKFDYPSEYLLSIWGYYSSDCAVTCVQSLTIESNKRIYGPFGAEKGKYFKFPLTSGKIVGFHGRSHHYLDCFGAYLEPISDPNQSKSVESFLDIRQPTIVGPFGGYGGNHWDDGIYATVRQFIIYAGVMVDSIQIEYDKNGESVWSQKHGESTGGSKQTVKFDYPDEFLLSISGYFSLESAFAALQSLTIHSNKRTYGPFGSEIGNHFTFPTSYIGNKIIGLHGRSGSHLDAIGAYLMSNPI
ncbi:mannose/glucose-specific lectin-like [Cornus florida]|uniref:mannose/glucose-specific lectin-like n=1 Tax=Cornus florida TaxID=4283 RepID=UPI0028974476|nr:mannose/glucose-specific lectin-like [Cornus florida]